MTRVDASGDVAEMIVDGWTGNETRIGAEMWRRVRAMRTSVQHIGRTASGSVEDRSSRTEIQQRDCGADR